MLYDAVVAGAGPAGAMAARELARAGLRLVIADALIPGAPKAGESLPAVGVRLMRSLGISVSDFGSVHPPVGGNLCCWTTRDLESADFFRDPDGNGWRVSRPEFDALLRESALESGAELRRSGVLTAQRTEQRWSVRLQSGEEIACRWIVDASGRASRLARAFGVTRCRDERLVALYRFAQSGVPHLNRTLIEAVPEGWWYGACLPGGGAVAALYVRPPDARSMAAQWHQACHKTRYLSEHFNPSMFQSQLFAAEAGGGYLSSFHGSGWVACGDAALWFDPLSSQGLYTAMYSGLQAAQALLAGSLHQYAERLESIRSVYRTRLAYHYATVQRFDAMA